MAGIARPYRRTARPIAGTGSYLFGAGGPATSYVRHREFAQEPENYLRAFQLLHTDLKRLFEYTEPADKNAKTYSFRVHEILLRACIEVEANCKAILKENDYPKQSDWTMNDYKKIEDSHRLSAFRVKVPSWRGTRNIRTPFASLASQPRKTPCWYKAYNDTKHDRHVNFAKASLGNAVDAVCGLQVMLAAQIVRQEFDPTSFPLRPDNDSDLFYPAQWSFFSVRFPDDWPPEQHYDLTNWEYTQPDPFQQFPYSAARPHPGHRGKPSGAKTTTHGNPQK